MPSCMHARNQAMKELHEDQLVSAPKLDKECAKWIQIAQPEK